MAFQLAEAYVQLGQRGFSGLMGKIGGIKQGLGSIASFATGPFAVALAGAGAGAGVAGMVALSAQLEQTETQFKTLLGSSDAAKKKIDELQSFAASTPFQFNGLAESAKTLLAFGTSNEQVVPTLKVLGDVAAASGNQVGELANIYGKVKARGSLMTEQLDQFNERAIPVGSKLAEMFGKTEAEIREMASKGQISFGDLQSAMQSMTEKGGIAFDGMKSQSTTLGGLWSTLKDNITLVMTDIGGAMIEGFELKSITANITGFVQKVRGEWMPSIVAGFQWAGDNIVKPVMGAVANMTAVVFEFVSNFDLYRRLMVANMANAMINIWEHISTGFTNGVTIIGWFASNFWTILNNVVKNVGTLFTNYFKQIWNNWKALLDFFRTGKIEFDFSPMKDSFERVLEGVELPELKAPNLNQMKGEFADIEQEFAKRQKARDDAARKAAAERVEMKKTELAIDKTAAAGKSKKEKKNSGSSDAFQKVGLAQLADKMQQQLGANQDSKEQKESARRTAAATQKLADAATGKGIKLAGGNAGPIKTPDRSFQTPGSYA